ncbi:MAG: hypothetical protein K2M57_06995 [Paramuribaculum sp.]|nr:hypothetical protein [Paramuribaculum sp.]
MAKAYQDTAAADEARRYMTAQYVRMERMFDKEKAAKNESYDFITRSGMLEDFNAFRNNPDSLELRKGTTDTPDLRRQLGEAHAEIICLSRKIAELRQQHTEISDRLKASEMRYEAYQEQNAALYLMTDTQNNRITKLMDMLERLTTKQRGQ